MSEAASLFSAGSVLSSCSYLGESSVPCLAFLPKVDLGAFCLLCDGLGEHSGAAGLQGLAGGWRRLWSGDVCVVPHS